MKNLKEINNKTELLQYLFQLKESGEIFRLGKLFSTERNNYFYDTGTGKVLLLEDGSVDMFNVLFNEDDKTTYNDFSLSLNERLSKAVNELIEAIKTENLLLAPQTDRLYTYNHYENLENLVNNELYQVILELTGRCNLRCGYCIYNESYEYNRNFNKEDMSKEVAKASIDYAKKHSGKEIAVTFYGGEPLLKFDLLKWCIEYAKETIQDKKLTFSFTTNLTLVTEEIAEYLSSVDNLSILCSLDGPEDVQDAYRKYAGGKGTFKDAMRGLKLLVDAFKDKPNNNISINGVLAPPYTFEQIEKIDSFYKGIEWLPKGISINTEYAAEGSVSDSEHINKLKNNPKYIKNGLNAINPLWDWKKRNFDKSLAETKNIEDDSISKILLRVHRRMISNEPIAEYPFNACCIPGRRRLYISTSGEFYVCERIGISPSIGNVFNGIDINELKKHYIDDFSKGSIDKCSKCWAIRLCGRCYIGNYTKDGFTKNSKDMNCNGEKSLIQRELSMYHSILETNPKSLDFLNDITVS